MIFFMLIPLACLAYVCWHLWDLIPLSMLWKGIVTGAMIVSFILLFVTVSRAIDRMSLWLARLVYDVGTSSIIVLLYLFLFFIVLDLGRLLHVVRWQWIHNNFATTVLLLIGLFVLFIAGNAHYRNKSRQELSLTTEKPLSSPLRIVMLSDLHIGYHNPRTELSRWVDLINDEKADMVLIAGDLIDMSMRPLEEENMAEELRRIACPVYACLGNHEYYTGGVESASFFKRAGIHLLIDSVATVGDVCIIGRDDRTNPHRQPLSALMEKADSSKYTIVLDHQPYQLEETEQAGADFQLSGHTHHGQVWPISWITDRIYECAYGPWQRGATRYYVSSGLGIWGGKFRIGTCSEYVVSEIRHQKQ